MFRDGKYYCNYCGKEITHRKKGDLKKTIRHFCNRQHFLLNNKNEVRYKEDYVVILVNYGKKEFECLVDIDDYENKIKNLGKKILAYKNGYCYFCVYGNGKKRKIKLYRYLLDVVDDNSIIIDHINRNKLDNRRKNLRRANYVLNRYNATSTIHGEEKGKCVFWIENIKNGEDKYV